MASTPGPTFAELLRRHRLAAGLTQEQLAERAGLSVRGISDLERGRRLRARSDTIALLAGALGLVKEEAARLSATVWAELDAPPAEHRGRQKTVRGSSGEEGRCGIVGVPAPASP
jgi:transcriptional regulator with XRE-family HTH domain